MLMRLEELLAAICDRLPGPGGDAGAKTQALIFDSVYDDYRGVAVDQRGRGLSEYDSNPDNYSAEVYMRDMFTLLDHLELDPGHALALEMRSDTHVALKNLPEALDSNVREVVTHGLATIRDWVREYEERSAQNPTGHELRDPRAHARGVRGVSCVSDAKVTFAF